MPVQDSKEDLAAGIEYYHENELKEFQRNNWHVVDYRFREGWYTGLSIADAIVPYWYIDWLDSQKKQQRETSTTDGVNLQCFPKRALEWRKLQLRKSRRMRDVKQMWLEGKPSEPDLPRKFILRPKSLGPFLYPTTLGVESMVGENPARWRCQCPRCSKRIVGSGVRPDPNAHERRRVWRDEYLDWEQIYDNLDWL